MATYLYCKWQAEVIFHQPDCDCETHLVGMFDHHDFGTDFSKISIKEKQEELFNYTPLVKPGSRPSIVTSCFAQYHSSLLKSFIAPPFHPPAA